MLESEDVFRCEWSPDGKQLLAGLNLPIENKGKIYRFSGANFSEREALTFEFPNQLGLGSQTFDGVRSMLFPDDGKTLICGTRTGILHFWNATSLEPNKSMRAHSKAILDIQVSQQHRLIATAGDDCYVRFWSMDSFELLQEIEFKEPVFHVDFADGRIVVAATELLSVAIENGRMARYDNEKIESSHFDLTHPTTDQRSLIVARLEGMSVYDIARKQHIRMLSYPNSDLNQTYSSANRMSLSSSDKLLFTSDRAGVKIWDFSSGRMEGRLNISGNFSIGLALHQSSERLAIWGDNRLDVYDIFETPIYFSSPTRQYELDEIDIDPLGKHSTDFSFIGFIGNDGPYQMQEFQTFSPSRREDICKTALFEGFRELAVSSDGNKVLLWNYLFRCFRVLDRENGQMHQIPFTVETANALELSEHGDIAYISHEEKIENPTVGSRAMDIVSAVRVEDGGLLWRWRNSRSDTSTPASILKMERSKNSLYLTCEDRTVRVIDLDKGVLQSEIHWPESPIRSICLGNLPELLIGTESGELLLYDIEQGMVSKRSPLHDRGITGLCRMADGTIISSSEDGTILFLKWNAE